MYSGLIVLVVFRLPQDRTKVIGILRYPGERTKATQLNIVLHSLKAVKFIESFYMLHIGVLHYTDMLPRYHLIGYTGTVLH